MQRRILLVALGFLLAQQVRADEPQWNADAAGKYLDGRGQWWLGWSGSARGQGTACISCHTGLPVALAQPALGKHVGAKEPGAVETALLNNVKKRVANWEKIVAEEAKEKDPFRPFYLKQRRPSALGTEAVLNALVLVHHERQGLSEPAKQALEHLWQQQQKNGAWIWLDFGLGPWEGNSEYYGAALAALAIGKAGADYRAQAALAPKVKALQSYLQENHKQPLHHRLVAAWASSARWPGLLSDPLRLGIINQLLSRQEPDGGWSLAKLGPHSVGKGSWTAHGATTKDVISDGYATGLAVLVLKSAQLPANEPQLRKGIAWLVKHQQKDGTWPALYINKDRDPNSDVGKFMRDAATGFAVLALTN
jgi:squalene-hopene/tetraprenyl-beta-curcumene cyclase